MTVQHIVVVDLDQGRQIFLTAPPDDDFGQDRASSCGMAPAADAAASSFEQVQDEVSFSCFLGRCWKKLHHGYAAETARQNGLHPSLCHVRPSRASSWSATLGP